MRLKALLRPVCWWKGHQSRMVLVALWLAEDAPKPPGTFCERCGKAPA